jgi:hypothetical protein
MSRGKPSANRLRRVSKEPNSTLFELRFLLKMILLINSPQAQAKASTIPQIATLDPKTRTRRAVTIKLIAK